MPGTAGGFGAWLAIGSGYAFNHNFSAKTDDAAGVLTYFALDAARLLQKQ